jgi:hypothetical protein
MKIIVSEGMEASKEHTTILCVCVCVREREIEKEREKFLKFKFHKTCNTMVYYYTALHAQLPWSI